LAVHYTLGGTATPGVDYSNLVGRVTIPKGKLGAVIPIKPIVDATPECAESVIVNLSPNANYTVGVPGSDTVTINDVPTISIVATDPSASEPGINRGKFSISRVGCTNASLKVFYTLGGTATYGSDYTNKPPLATSVSIPAGKTNVVITVFPKDDVIAESFETVTLTLSSRPTYTIGSPVNATVTISDND
jgi:hypothetical protein